MSLFLKIKEYFNQEFLNAKLAWSSNSSDCTIICYKVIYNYDWKNEVIQGKNEDSDIKTEIDALTS